MSVQHHRRGGVRLYNRALTQGEIQTVMIVPVALPAPPTVLSLAAPASAAAVGQ